MIRVLVANSPRLMRDLVIESLTGQPDIEVLENSSPEMPLLEQIEENHPNFLILTLADDGRRPAACDVILKRFPALRIVAIAAHGNQCVLFWMKNEISFAPIDLSTEGILKAMRRRVEIRPEHHAMWQLKVS